MFLLVFFPLLTRSRAQADHHNLAPHVSVRTHIASYDITYINVKYITRGSWKEETHSIHQMIVSRRISRSLWAKVKRLRDSILAYDSFYPCANVRPNFFFRS